MKKILLPVLLSCLFTTGTYLQAAAPRHKPEAQAAPNPAVVTRSSQDPSTLRLFDKQYPLSTSEESDIAENMWVNIYPLDGEDESEEIIQIGKVPNTTCQELLESQMEDPEDFLTLDQRNPQNILFSQMDDETYVAGRLVQVGNDVFMLMMAVAQPQNTQQSQPAQAQRKQIFSAVRNTSANVIAEHFVQAVCKLGSDCRL